MFHRWRGADHHADADLLPLIRDLDGDPVHVGLVFIITATIGNFTPPVGPRDAPSARS
jgi:hypothetical protein